KEAEMHAEEDKAKKEIVDMKNQAGSIAFDMEKQLKEYGDKLQSEDDKKDIEEKIAALRAASTNADITKEELQKAIDDCLTAAQKIGEAMNQAQQQAGTNAGAEAGAEGATEGSTTTEETPVSEATEGETVEEGEVVKN
ncbi:MAG: Hsp70 family protein, partial [Pseudomonadales bacterium]|nr:Hsp70 family protein [Pseudomonadales bacterium]